MQCKQPLPRLLESIGAMMGTGRHCCDCPELLGTRLGEELLIWHIVEPPKLTELLTSLTTLLLCLLVLFGVWGRGLCPTA